MTSFGDSLWRNPPVQLNGHRCDCLLQTPAHNFGERHLVEDLDNLTGVGFEMYLAKMLKDHGFDDIRTTVATGDQGAWVITTGTFTASAKALAQANNVKLIDGHALRNRRFPLN